jgi:hypothetical protein
MYLSHSIDEPLGGRPVVVEEENTTEVVLGRDEWMMDVGENKILTGKHRRLNI